MRTLAARTQRPDAQAGFALIGVVMFVLVLTILGLSLFTLSGFESQFMQSSMDRAEAMFTAASGLDRALFVLARTESLGAVTKNPPIADSIVYALARQDGKPSGPDSTADIDWSGGDILVRVMAQNDGQRKMIEAKFHPSSIDLYDRLMTLSAQPDPAQGDTGLFVYRHSHHLPPDTTTRWPQTYLRGEVWQNPGTNVTTHIFRFGSIPVHMAPSPLGVTFRPGSDIVPHPDVQSYLQANLGNAPNPITPSEQGGRLRFTLDASGNPDDVKFYKSSGQFYGGALNSGGYSLNLESALRPEFYVNGTAIWMLPNGLRSYHTVEVFETPDATPDMLVLVCGKHVASNTGFMLHGALDAGAVPIILVTDGRAVLQNHLDAEQTTRIDWLSIYAWKALIMGPESKHPPGIPPYKTMTLSHPNLPAVKALLEKLYDLGLLPNLQGGVRGKFQQVAGTWREIPQPN